MEVVGLAEDLVDPADCDSLIKAMTFSEGEQGRAKATRSRK